MPRIHQACIGIIHNCSCFALLLFAFASTCGADDMLIDRIARDWKRRRNQIDRVTYVTKGFILYPKGSLNNLVDDPTAEYPPEDTKTAHEISLSLDFENRFARKEIKAETFVIRRNDVSIRSTHDVHLFNGNELQWSRPRKSNRHRKGDWPELFIKKTANTGFFFQQTDYPFFFAHGVIPSPGSPIDLTANIRNSIDTTLLAHAGTITRSGRHLTVVRTKNLSPDREHYYELWIDLERESAIVYWANIKKATKITINLEYQKYDQGWYPQRWTWSSLTLGKLEMYREFSVVDVIFNPTFPKAHFHVTPTVGMIVSDRRTGREYRVKKVGAKEEIEDNKRALQSSAPRAWWPWITAGIVFAVLSSLLVNKMKN